jgi:ATP-dependent RNA helicase SUPV3L1/SUV3
VTEAPQGDAIPVAPAGMATESDALAPSVDGGVAAPGEEPTAEATTAEPAFIEIWRPHRFGRRPDQRNKGRQRPAGEPQAAAQPAPTEGAQPRPPRHERRRDERRGERAGGDHKGRPPRHGPRREESRQDRPRQQTPVRAERPERPERQKQADPLSPFAALAALKAQLEAQKRDG